VGSSHFNESEARGGHTGINAENAYEGLGHRDWSTGARYVARSLHEVIRPESSFPERSASSSAC
jgi:hypothetical protein